MAVLYDVIKDAASAAQAAQNIGLYQKLLDAQGQALELQEENIKLQEEIGQLRDMKELERGAEYHPGAPIVFFKDYPKIPFCSTCWGRDRRRIKFSMGQIPLNDDDLRLVERMPPGSKPCKCPVCDVLYALTAI